MSELLWSLVELSATVVEAWLLLSFATAFLGEKFSKNKSTACLVCGTTVFSVCVAILNSVVYYEGVLVLLFSIIIFAYACIVLEGRFIKRVFASVLPIMITTIISLSVISAMSVISGYSSQELMSVKSIPRLIILFSTKLFLFYVLQIVKNILPGREVSLGKAEWFQAISVLVISVIIITIETDISLMLQTNKIDSNKTIYVILGVIAINVMLFYMTIKLSKSNKLKQEHLLLQQQHYYQKDYAKNIKFQEDEIRSIKHDFKHCVSVIETLLDEGKVEKAKQFLLEYNKEIKTTSSYVSTDNEFVNAIINSKFSYAKKSGIDVFCMSISNFNGFSDVDLCSLLGNALDNAVQGCLKVTDFNKNIELRISGDDVKVTISIKNSVHENVLEKNPNLKTDKTIDKINHGYGVQTMKNIVNKYNGDIDFYIEENNFCTQMILYREETQN